MLRIINDNYSKIQDREKTYILKGTIVNGYIVYSSWLQHSSYAMSVFSQYKSTNQIPNGRVIDESIAGITKVYSFHTHY